MFLLNGVVILHILTDVNELDHFADAVVHAHVVDDGESEISVVFFRHAVFDTSWKLYLEGHARDEVVVGESEDDEVVQAVDVITVEEVLGSFDGVIALVTF